MIFDTFLVISWDSVYNLESEPVDFNTMNPIIGTIFFLTYKGVRAIFNVDFPKEDEVGKL